MKYLCLGYHDEKLWQAMPEGERNALMDETFAYADHLKTNGHIVDDHALQSATTAATLRFERGRDKVAVTDGPFAETKEQLGGLIILEANDLNHAVQLMSQMPCMSLGGSIEIRPINAAIKFQTEAGAVCLSAT
jgi:hypothetical protein